MSIEQLRIHKQSGESGAALAALLAEWRTIANDAYSIDSPHVRLAHLQSGLGPLLAEAFAHPQRTTTGIEHGCLLLQAAAIPYPQVFAHLNNVHTCIAATQRSLKGTAGPEATAKQEDWCALESIRLRVETIGLPTGRTPE